MNNKDNKIVCQLSSEELRHRRYNMIKKLKDLVKERTETNSSVLYKFESSDNIIDLLTDFIKAERLCCSFFSFTLLVGYDDEFIWLDLSGPEGVIEFIKTEIDF